MITGGTEKENQPWSIRNSQVKDNPAIIEPTWADTIFARHNPYATGGPDFYFAEHEHGKFYLDESLTKKERSRLALQKTLVFIRENPLREVQLTLLKLSKHLTFVTSFGTSCTRWLPVTRTF